MWTNFRFWLLGGSKVIRQPREINGETIAREFFLWLEKWPLRHFWKVGDAHSNSESCPYPYFEAIAIKKLAGIIDANLRGGTGAVISPPLWKRLYNRYLRKSPRQSISGGQMESKQDKGT